VDTQTAIVTVNMEPLPQGRTEGEKTMDIEPPAVTMSTPRHQEGANAPYVRAGEPALPAAAMSAPDAPADPAGASAQILIPDYITVHLGIPSNASARNVRVRFIDYIKNVASSEIYPTWPHNALVANIHAIVTFTLNRVFTEWYRARGHNFDITNSTAYDQAYRDGGPIYESVSRIVDDMFNVYAHRYGFRNPFFTSYCNGTTATCAGLSQWGTVTLANQGLTPLQILRRFYPNDLTLGTSNNIAGITESYPGYALSLGSQGEPVRRMQNFLNRIRVNFPLIPQIPNPNGVFGPETRNAVTAFQRSFNLASDGIIGRATWNRISITYVGVTRLAELDGEGERVSIGQNPPGVTLRMGDRGANVLELQFILNSVSPFHQSVPTVIKDSVFGADTKNAVIEFQRTFGLTPDGVVGPATWNMLYSVYRGIHANAPVPPSPPPPPNTTTPPFPGTLLRAGSSGPDVKLMQTYLNVIRMVYTNIPYVEADGVFGNRTRDAVIAFQREFLLSPDGIIGPITWPKIVSMYQTVTGYSSVSLEYPGTLLRTGSRGADVRLMQSFLADLRVAHPGLAHVAVDGIFGPQTHNAVVTFQRMFGLAPDGIIGPLTWAAIVRERGKI
ncbi:MAG: peptidoglycan-binding protein, partial [Oscillospiraceae bacterium]|nr:peptidoglycan-binding protein [Oscillospiraceae bacterium]